MKGESEMTKERKKGFTQKEVNNFFSKCNLWRKTFLENRRRELIIAQRGYVLGDKMWNKYAREIKRVNNLLKG